MSIEKKDGTVRVVEGLVMYRVCKGGGYNVCRYHIPVDKNWIDDDSIIPCEESDEELLQFYNNFANGDNEYVNDDLCGIDYEIDMFFCGCNYFRAVGFDKVSHSKSVGIIGEPKEHEHFSNEFDAIKSVCDVTLKKVS